MNISKKVLDSVVVKVYFPNFFWNHRWKFVLKNDVTKICVILKFLAKYSKGAL